MANLMLYLEVLGGLGVVTFWLFMTVLLETVEALDTLVILSSIDSEISGSIMLASSVTVFSTLFGTATVSSGFITVSTSPVSLSSSPFST